MRGKFYRTHFGGVFVMDVSNTAPHDFAAHIEKRYARIGTKCRVQVLRLLFALSDGLGARLRT